MSDLVVAVPGLFVLVFLADPLNVVGNVRIVTHRVRNLLRRKP